MTHTGLLLADPSQGEEGVFSPNASKGPRRALGRRLVTSEVSIAIHDELPIFNWVTDPCLHFHIECAIDVAHHSVQGTVA